MARRWRSTSGSRRSTPPRLLPAYVAAIILGVLGMHALVQHCPMPAGGPPSMSSPMLGLSGVDGAAAAASEHVHETAVEAAKTGARAAESIVAHRGAALGGAVMLCGAMLLGLGAALLLRMRERGGTTRPGATRLRDRVVKPLLRPAATGPPASLAFVVIRC